MLAKLEVNEANVTKVVFSNSIEEVSIYEESLIFISYFSVRQVWTAI
jgi:hypothetical protein